MVGIELVRDKHTQEPFPLQVRIGQRVAVRGPGIGAKVVEILS